MRLSKFKVKNFKGIEDVTFDWDDIVVLIGENNTGKSSVLQALELFCGGTQIKDPALFRDEQTDKDHAIELTGYFTDLDKGDLQKPVISGNVHDGQWCLRKSFWVSVDEEGKEKAEELYQAYHGATEYVGWPEKGAKFSDFPEEYQPFLDAVRSEPSFDSVKSATIKLKERLQEVIREQAPHLTRETEAQWHDNPGGGGNWKSNANSCLPEVLHVPAVEDVGDATQPKTTTVYGRIVGRVLEKKLMLLPEFKDLRDHLEKIRCLFTPPPGSDQVRAEAIDELQEDINRGLKDIMTAASAEIHAEAPDIGSLLLPTTMLKIDDGWPTTVENQGHGLQRALLVALFQVLASQAMETDEAPAKPEEEAAESVPVFQRALIFAVEEPEIYMHPQMARKMRDALYSLSRQDGYQVICSTHSPVFLDMAGAHTAIVRLEKDDERRVTAFQVREEIFSGVKRDEQKRHLRMITEFDPTVNELFFAKRVVLVEGDTEMAVIPKASELLGIFEDEPDLRHDVTLINCHGKSTIPLFQAVLNHFRIAYQVMHDEDLGKATAENVNQTIANACGDRGSAFAVCPDLEGVLGYDAGHRDKPIIALVNLVGFALDNDYLPRDFIDCIYRIYTGDPCPDANLEANGDGTLFRCWRPLTARH